MVEWIAVASTCLNSDAALGFEIDYVDADGTPCNRFGGPSGCNDPDGNPIAGCVVCPELTTFMDRLSKNMPMTMKPG
jgi:hypothetical protein